MTTPRLLPFLFGALLLVGCSKKSEGSSGSESKDESKDEKKAKKSKGDDDDDDNKKTKKPKGSDKGEKAEKVEMADLDLSSVAAWKGWTISAPAGAKAAEDAGDLEVTGKSCSGEAKCPYFDLTLSQKKPDLAATKKLQTEEATAAKDKISFTVETDTELEWTRESGDAKTSNFVYVVKSGTDEIGCWPSSSVIADADFARMKAACKTAAKK